MRPLFALSFMVAIATVIGCSSNPTTSDATPSTSTPTSSTVIAPEAAAPEAAESADSEPETMASETTSAAAASPLPAVYEESGIAIAGADPVAYFTDGTYVPGSSQFTHDWSGVTWQFASAENRDTFAADPAAYAPQYGGFCAWAVSQGYTAAIDPTAWKIVNGRLYLNYDQSVQARWERDIPGNIAQADANWPQVATE